MKRILILKFIFLMIIINSNCVANDQMIFAETFIFKLPKGIYLNFEEPILYVSKQDGITLEYYGKYRYRTYEKLIIVQFRFKIDLIKIRKYLSNFEVKEISWDGYDPGISRNLLFKDKYVNTKIKNDFLIRYSYNDRSSEFLWDLSHYLISFSDDPVFKECYILLGDVWLYNHKEVSGNQFLKVEELKKKNPKKAVLYNLLEEFIFSVEYIDPLNEDTKALKNTAEQP